jgi:carbohydrate-binding DOMON domain-containing protein
MTAVDVVAVADAVAVVAMTAVVVVAVGKPGYKMQVTGRTAFVPMVSCSLNQNTTQYNPLA